MSSSVSHENLPYVPPPSLGFELGILFGFLGLNVVGHLIFWFWWARRNRVEAAIERARLDALLAASRRSGRVMESPDMTTVRQQQWHSGDALRGPGFGGALGGAQQHAMADTGPSLGTGENKQPKRVREWWEELDLA